MSDQGQAHRDLETLLLQDEFLRFLFTVFDTAGMYTAAYSSEEGHLARHEGRRSLGLDILATIEAVRADAHISVLKSQHDHILETENERPRPERTNARDEQFLDYGADASGGS